MNARKMITDDIGSFPAPGIERKRAQEIALSIASGSCCAEDKTLFDNAVSSAMQMKLDSGIDVPNFPQFADMISGFFSLIENFQSDEPWVVQREKAAIPEIESLKKFAKKRYDETGKPLELRACVTGPLELYLKTAGNSVEGDLLANIAKSVSFFVENSAMNEKYIKTSILSIDEPSLGLNPNIMADEGDLAKAWEISVGPAKGIDVHVHLHSPNDMDKFYGVAGVNVIGIEAAEEPNNLGIVDKEGLEENGKFLRIGVARTNIFGIASDFLGKTGIDVWREPAKLGQMVDDMEGPEIIGKRLEKAHGMFGELIKYVGPDCGLGSWPTAQAASLLLKNTTRAVNEFKGGNRNIL
ncbi:MAG: hypothetical protein MSIBF_02450 [Candidatus Altiarchaeales archaeon IMC4]|nr:MAG: hypothetical protein MSIBF_02450 [Candidatus Altiarchaeales archaeon IMC4]